MVEGRKMKCHCGAFLEEKEGDFDGFKTEALICPKCGHTAFTRQQADKYVKLRHLHKIMDAERKVIKIGNSMGFTLPDSMKEFGLKVGSKIRTEAIGNCAFKVEF
jgi:hypothetical protein